MFLEAHLQQLRRDHFSPRALLVYSRHVGIRIRDDLVASPGAVRSIWSLALAYFAVAFVAAVAMSIAWDRRLAYAFFLQTALWMLPAFAFVTLFVGQLRDMNGYRLSAINVPTALTLLRVSLVPSITLFLLERHFMLAFVTYLAAAISDVLDGWIARRWRQQTPLGTVLDPLVDIVFNLTALAGLAAADLLHPWVFWMAVLRYGVLLVGGSAIYVLVGPIRIRPTWFGRMTGVVMTCLVALFILLVAVRGPVGAGLTRLTEIALGVMLSATVLQVLVLGWYNLRLLTGAARQADRVVRDVQWRA